jgi:hypothetical protein
MENRTDIRRRLDLHNIASISLPPAPGAAVSLISILAGFASCRIGTTAPVSYRTPANRARTLHWPFSATW